MIFLLPQHLAGPRRAASHFRHTTIYHFTVVPANALVAGRSWTVGWNHGDPTVLRRPMRDLGLLERTLNHLEYQGIKTLRGLLRYSKADMLAWRGFAESSLRDVQRAVARFGLTMRRDDAA